MKKLIPSLLVIFLFSIHSLFAQTDTIVYRPGPEGGIDAETRDDLPDQNRGDFPDFIANAWTAQGNFFIMRSFIRFDLSAIPQNTTVISAILDLYTNTSTGHYQMDSGPNQSYFMRILTNWDEHTITWNNQPSATMSGAVILPRSTSNTQTYHLDLTTHVQDMVTHPEANFGWMFRLETEDIYRCLAFASSDHPNPSLRPRLTVIYSNCAPPVANFSTARDGNTVTFTDLSTAVNSWYWEFGDGWASSLQNPTHNYTQPGNFLVQLTVEDTCSISHHFETITIPCNPPDAGFYYSFNEMGVAFFDTTTSPTVYSWYWDFGDGNFSTLPNPTNNYANPGDYNVCLIVTDSCTTDSVCHNVAYFPPLKANFSSGQSATNGLEVAFFDKTEGANQWVWDFGDGKSSDLQNPVHTYPTYGTYNVCLTVGNDYSTATSCDSLQLKSLVFKNIHGIASLLPNPIKDNEAILYFGKDHTFVTITMVDITGKNILQTRIEDVTSSSPVIYKLPVLTGGIYFLRIEVEGDQKVIKMLVP